MDISALLSPENLIPLATGAATAIFTIIIGYMIAGWAKGMAVRALEASKVDAALSGFIGSMVRYVIIFATFIAAAEAVGFETTSLMAIFASAGLAVGLALQGSLSNFASGVMILFFRPFTISDVITAGGTTGQVLEIGLFATTLNQPDGTKVIVPNSGLTGGTISNHTMAGRRRGSVDIGVEYGADIAQVRSILEAAAKKCPQVMDDPGPAVAFVSFGASSLDFQVHVWATPAEFLDALDGTRVHIYNDLNAANIGIPYQTVDVNMIPQG